MYVPLSAFKDADSDNGAKSGRAGLLSGERERIVRALREAKVVSRSKGAATHVSMNRTTLNSKLKNLRIERRAYAQSNDE